MVNTVVNELEMELKCERTRRIQAEKAKRELETVACEVILTLARTLARTLT